MQTIYTNKGGSNFQWETMCGPVLLDADDIDSLEKTVQENKLPYTTGFFFGESRPEDKDTTLEFCKKARIAI